MVDQKTIDRWMDEYIHDININRRKYLVLNASDLNIFIINNYYDMRIDKIVTGDNHYMPIGMQYLEYNCFEDEAYGGQAKFLICYTPNNVGRNTILSEMRYYEGCTKIARGQTIPVTYIEYMETNRFFRNQGLSKELMKEFSKVVDRNNPLLGTNETVLGSRYHMLKNLKEILIANGFEQDIRCDYEITHEYYDYLRTNNKELVLKK